MEIKKFKYLYPAFDFISAFIAWHIFCALHKAFIEGHLSLYHIPKWYHSTLLVSSLLIPLLWLLLYYCSRYYNNPLRKTILEDLRDTIIQSLVGVCLLFFILVFFVSLGKFHSNYTLIFLYLAIHIGVTFLARLGLTSHIMRLKFRGKIFFRTIMIGRVNRIFQMKSELDEKYPGHSHLFVGYVPVDSTSNNTDEKSMSQLGEINDLHQIIIDYKIEDVIIILNETDIEIYKQIKISLNSSRVELKINTELYPIIKGKVSIASLFQYPLIQISRDLLPYWQSILKNTLDITGAIFGLIITLPISIALIIAIRFTSAGPVIYSHERIGRFGKSFKILKFRSMIKNAEANGPRLSSKNDPRITKVGRFMRRSRLDEIPNFINVLKGDMSLVGPRPERKFYMDQIIVKAPDYKRLLQVKPGVTSWGQVKYGYAENIDEMVRRMRYDLLYMENMSLYVDFQILVRTILIILKRRGI